MATCTAPIEGHSSPAAAAQCPACSPSAGKTQTSIVPPSLPATEPSGPESAHALIDALKKSSASDWAEVRAIKERLAVRHIETFVSVARLACPSLAKVEVSTEALDEYGPSIQTTLFCDHNDGELTTDEWCGDHELDTDEFVGVLNDLGANNFDDYALYHGFESHPEAFNGYVMDLKGQHFAALGIDEENEGAKAALREFEWWNLTPDSKAVKSTLIMHANP